MASAWAEHMVGAITKSNSRLVAGREKFWEEIFNKASYGYRLRPLEIGSLPYKVTNGLPPHLVPSDDAVGHDTPTKRWMLENVSTISVCAKLVIKL